MVRENVTIDEPSTADDLALPADDSRLLLRDLDLANLLGCSVGHVRSLDKRGLIPAAVHLGRCVRWSRPVIERWIACNCPPRGRWEAMTKANGETAADGVSILR